MTKVQVLPLLAAIVLLAALVGCAHSTRPTSAATEPSFKDMTIDQLAELRKAGPVVVLDANGADFRQQNGIIPGAVLLPSSSKYDLSQLPEGKSRKLVFYCASRI